LITTIDGPSWLVSTGTSWNRHESYPAIGDFYRQEFSLDNAEDFTETSVSLSPYRCRRHVQQLSESQETNALEPTSLNNSFYARASECLTVDAGTGEGGLVQIIPNEWKEVTEQEVMAEMDRMPGAARDNAAQHCG